MPERYPSQAASFIRNLTFGKHPFSQDQLSAANKTTMENGTPSAGDGKDPSGFLSEIIGNPVTVKLNSGVVYKGE